MSGLTTIDTRGFRIVDSNGGLHIKRVDSQGNEIYIHIETVIDSSSQGEMEVELLSLKGIPNHANHSTWAREVLTNTGEILTLTIPNRGRPIITRNYPLMGVDDIGLYHHHRMMLLDSGDVYISVNGELYPLIDGIKYLVPSTINGLMIDSKGQLIKYSRSKGITVLYQGLTDIKLIRENVIVLTNGVILAIDYMEESIVRYDIPIIIKDIYYQNNTLEMAYLLILTQGGILREIDLKTGQLIDNRFVYVRQLNRLMSDVYGYITLVGDDGRAQSIIGSEGNYQIDQLNIPVKLLVVS